MQIHPPRPDEADEYPLLVGYHRHPEGDPVEPHDAVEGACVRRYAHVKGGLIRKEYRYR